MRKAFVEALCALAAADPRVWLLTADLGWGALEPFAQRFPDRFLNVGVAEQNMLGVATGLAREGCVPFAYSIATFASMRCYEQFRNGPVLHRLPVRLVGIGGGFSYGHAGPTHHALEDLAIARTQPGVTVIAPADPAQTRSVIEYTPGIAGPVYLRIDKNAFPNIPALRGDFALDTPVQVRPGRDALLLCTGSIVHEALKATDLLQPQRIAAGVAVLAHLGYRGGPALVRLLREYHTVVTVEEGSIVGGLGSLTAETIAEHGLACRLVMQGVGAPPAEGAGGSGYMLRRHGLDAASLARRVLMLHETRAAA
jgi:transketolase